MQCGFMHALVSIVDLPTDATWLVSDTRLDAPICINPLQHALTDLRRTRMLGLAAQVHLSMRVFEHDGTALQVA